MTLFCLLWVPLVYLFRRSFSSAGSSGIWALLLGSITAIIQFFLGDIGSPGGFGFSRWLFGFINIVCIPVLLPLVIYTLLCVAHGFQGQHDFPDFTLLWLMPVGALWALSWSATNIPLLLVTVPLLWTALAVGIPFFIKLTANQTRWQFAALFILCIALMPALAASAYWAFFAQYTVLGFILFFLANVPMCFSFYFEIMKR
jgi:hypothetical protein